MRVLLKNDNPLSECYLRYSAELEASDKYDCIVEKADCTPEILGGHKRILLVERLDGAAIWCRDLLKHPNVKTLLKMYHYPDTAINNRECVGGRIFIPEDGSEKKPAPELTGEDMAKIQPGFNFMHYSRMNMLYEFAKVFPFKQPSERQYDFFFAGTTFYKGEGAGAWITKHREETLHAVNALGAKGYHVLAAGTRAFRPMEYFQILADTKIILSPFGWGEFCYRDYEAIACGCLLVKPQFPSMPESSPCINKFIHLMFSDPAYYLLNQKGIDEKTKERREWILEQKANEKQIIERILE